MTVQSRAVGAGRRRRSWRQHVSMRHGKTNGAAIRDGRGPKLQNNHQSNRAFHLNNSSWLVISSQTHAAARPDDSAPTTHAVVHFELLGN